MLHPKIKKLVEEIFARYGENEKRIKKYPEVYLLSLLEGIKERLSEEVSTTLNFTVEMARFGSGTDRFRETLTRIQSEPLTVRKTVKKTAKRRSAEMVVA